MRREQEPSVRPNTTATKGEVFEHPAYGVIRLSAVQGGKPTLFGSDISHHERVRIEVRRAYMNRTLSRDWTHQGESIVEFEMSFLQLAQFMMSAGRGEGTPITLLYAPAPGTATEAVPAIGQMQSKAQVHEREIADAAKRQLDKMNAAIARFGAMLAEGKTGKKDLADIQRELAIASQNLPANLAFAVNQAHETFETVVNDAKMQIEAAMTHAANRMGWSQIDQLTTQSSPSAVASIEMERDATQDSASDQPPPAGT